VVAGAWEPVVSRTIAPRRLVGGLLGGGLSLSLATVSDGVASGGGGGSAADGGVAGAAAGGIEAGTSVTAGGTRSLRARHHPVPATADATKIYDDAAERYNQAVAAYNASCAGHSYDETVLRQVQAAPFACPRADARP